jgi:hypothetical protein
MKAIPLRTAEERLAFCDAYFAAVNASIVYQSEDYREYELPRDVDKELTDKPFYWMWVEQTKQDVPPGILRLAFTEESLQRENDRLRKEALAEAERQPMTDVQRMFFRPPVAELVTLGSFRLDKIYASLDVRGRFACIAPTAWDEVRALVPWLMINGTVSYRSDLVEQEFISAGVCLVNGQVVERFYDMIQKIAMKPVRPKYLVREAELAVDQGLDRFRQHLVGRLAGQSHEWAKSAEQRLQREIQQIRTYYRSILADVPDQEKPLVDAERARKERDLTERLQPAIEIDVKQMALVGLVER